MAKRKAVQAASSRAVVEHVSTDYAREVVSGERLACKWVKLACRRFLEDFSREDIRFDVAAADRVIGFLESFRHYKGEWAGQKMKLEPWQKFVVSNIFGWKWVKNGRRRYRYAYIEVPRKNGKTILAAGIAIYMLCADSEGGAEVYTTATKKDQAMISWKDAQVLIQNCKDPDFKAAMTIRKNPAIVEYEAANAFLRPLGRDADGDTTDGLNPHCIVADELHAWKTEGFWQVLDSALGARSQPVFLMISTAGNSLESVGKTRHDIVKEMLEGRADDIDDFFGIIYTVDEGDDIEDPKTWEKANPLYGVTVDEDKFRAKLAQAKLNPASMRELLTKWLNQWLNQAQAWLDSEKWDKCVLEFDREKLKGLKCYGGLDLALTRDLSALALVFPPQDFLERWTVLMTFWCPEEDIKVRSRRDKVPYQTWREKGHIVMTPGEVMDHTYIQKAIIQASEDYELMAVGYDKTYTQQIIQPLLDAGVNMLSVSQGILTMSPMAKELERLVIDKKLNHFGHPVLAWNAYNCVVETDANGNIKPSKSKSDGKTGQHRTSCPNKRIDGLIALIIGLGVGIEMEYEAAEADFEVTVI